MDTEPDIIRRAEYNVSPERVWNAWTDPEILARWFAPQVEMELRPKGKLEFSWPEQGDTTVGVIEVLEPPRRLRFSWKSFSPETRRRIPGDWKTTVEVLIEPIPSGSRLLLREWFDQVPDAHRPTGRKDNSEGWDLCLAALASELAEGRAQ